MIYILIVLFLLIFVGADFAESGSFHADYCSKNATTAINGIFVVLVFLRHFSQYVEFTAAADLPWAELDAYLGQLIVVSFLFYSGYGILCSVEQKGTPYVKKMFTGRFLRVLLHFDICVLLFAVTDLVLGKALTVKDVLLALTSWGSIGNSNWYITAILVLYLFTIFSFLCFRKHPIPALVLITLLTLLFVYVNIKLKRPAYTYNTVIVYPLGMWFAYLQPYMDRLLQKNSIFYSIVIFICTFAFVWAFQNRTHGIAFYTIWVCAFTGLIVLFSMKIKVTNPVLLFFGRHVFSIYILQRIPMMIFDACGFGKKPIQLFLVSFAATIVLALLFDMLMEKLDAVLFRQRKVSEKTAA